MLTISITYTSVIFVLPLILHITITPWMAAMPYLEQNMWYFNTVWSVNTDGVKYSFTINYLEIIDQIVFNRGWWLTAILYSKIVTH